MRILLIRHGRQESPLCNVDVPLAEEGRRQAELLGERLAGKQIDAVWSSNLIRAVETADIINEKLNVERVIREELKEISFGDMEGLSDEVIADRYEDFLRARLKLERDMSYPGGECAAEVLARVLPIMKEITSKDYETVVIVTHGGVIRSLVAHYLGMDLARVPLLATQLENCGITELWTRKHDGRIILNRFNDASHLEGHPELLRGGWKGKK
ncbi:MAG: histidine phosphatase family protein [Lachnospiraceae bacterium]|nr:histidine phosphatase family protein [Lachnospiraceae bacterium]MBQ5699019.1 histidine phosphatase family protein [Lachnospiraceae bacterium]MBQ5806132.1 histidine phosphatase family protein [Lachnospiraceae bacterium]